MFVQLTDISTGRKLYLRARDIYGVEPGPKFGSILHLASGVQDIEFDAEETPEEIIVKIGDVLLPPAETLPKPFRAIGAKGPPGT